ncbi:hypothetical protein STEG23_026371, partial [Scotinomys teguina]
AAGDLHEILTSIAIKQFNQTFQVFYANYFEIVSNILKFIRTTSDTCPPNGDGSLNNCHKIPVEPQGATKIQSNSESKEQMSQSALIVNLTQTGIRPTRNFNQGLVFIRFWEQPVTLGRRGPKSNQSPLEEEDPRAASHPQRTSPSHFLRPRSRQSPSEEEDPGATSHPQIKRTKEQPVTLRGRGSRSTQTLLEQETSPAHSSKEEMGRHQCKSTYNNNMKNKTSPESSPPPTPRPEHCNTDKAEENDLKNSLMKMIEEVLKGKMKNAINEIEEKPNKKLEENDKEIKEKNKKIKEMNKEIEDKNKKWKKYIKKLKKQTKNWRKSTKKLRKRQSKNWKK